MRFVNVLLEFYAPERPVRRGNHGLDFELPPNCARDDKITFAYIDECEIAKLEISLAGKAVMADRKLLERYIIAYTKSNHLWNHM